MHPLAPLLPAAVLFLASCGSADEPASGATDPADTTEEAGAPVEQEFPDVIGVEATDDGGSWTFAVTISSPYDTPERYADAWRVLGPDGEEYGIRILTHDHASEQPFTRSQSGIVIPAGVEVVTVEARDLANGWGGTSIDYELPE